ncbi:MAG TPA: glycosyltransferase [Thermoanaerobaculia bacterium]|jgi:ceramide glucosyltransferase
MSVPVAALGYLAFAGLVLSVAAHAASAVALLVARRRSRGEPVAGWEPGVSIVKPLCGVDENLEENLESFFGLDYGEDRHEVIFSFASQGDAAYPIARRVADRHPRIPAVFVFDAREPGGNAKVNRLIAALRHARHRLVLFSDGNVRVRPDFLRRAVSWFAPSRKPGRLAPPVGLVSHLFLARGARGAASRVETLYLNGCLQGGTALLAGALGMPCVVGKSILVSRRALDAVEGIGALREHLAEDFLLGRHVRRAGFRVALSADFLDTAEVRKSARAVWARHRRWAMMRRRLGGPLYPGELLAPALPWFLASIAAGPGGTLAAAAGALLALRYLVEMAVGAAVGRRLDARDVLLLPVRDLAVFAVFCAGLTGRRVAWRGRAMRIGKETLILETPPRAA